MEKPTQKVPTVFDNGVQFLFPRSEYGPSLYGIMEGMWLNVMLIEGIRRRIWETSAVGEPDAVAAAWATLGLIKVTPADGAFQIVLSEEGKNVVACRDLMEYEFAMVNRQLNGETTTDPALYATLRRGLSAYADRFLPDLLRWVGDIAKQYQDPVTMDYCGGDGTYAKVIDYANPDSVGWLMDRTVSAETREELVFKRGITIREGDVLDPALTEDLDGLFDIIVASEILHCKGPADRKQMIADIYRMLAPGGTAVFIEQFPNRRLEWRMEQMTAEGQCLRAEQLAYEVQEQPFVQVATGYIEAISHYGFAVQKPMGEVESK